MAVARTRLRAEAEHFYPPLPLPGNHRRCRRRASKKKNKNNSQIADVNTILHMFVHEDGSTKEEKIQILTRYDLDLLRRLLATDISDFCLL